ncbi:hypothetical protein RyT2_00710 [Pseudolactococcus yaeyamensis]
MDDLRYKALDSYTLQEAREILSQGILEELMLLPLSVGESDIDCLQAQEICPTLLKHESDKRQRSIGISLYC